MILLGNRFIRKALIGTEIQGLSGRNGMALFENDKSAKVNTHGIPEQYALQEKMLKREIEAIALKRLEDSARTVTDFQNVIDMWDRLDANRERRERYHEIGRDDSKVPLEWGGGEDYAVVPVPKGQAFWRELMRGNFLDIIFNCPFEIHELVEDVKLSRILLELKDEYKELLYYLSVRRYSTAYIAKMLGQTDRNIRKKRTTILKKIWKQYNGNAQDHTVGEDMP